MKITSCGKLWLVKKGDSHGFPYGATCLLFSCLILERGGYIQQSLPQLTSSRDLTTPTSFYWASTCITRTFPFFKSPFKQTTGCFLCFSPCKHGHPTSSVSTLSDVARSKISFFAKSLPCSNKPCYGWRVLVEGWSGLLGVDGGR